MNMELNLNQTVVNAFRILECFDEKSRSYTCRELSDKLNISNSSTWRLVQTLEYMGYLERLDNDRYSLGLVIARLMAQCLDNKYPIPRIVESLNKASGSHVEQNLYVFDYTDEILEAIREKLDIDSRRKYLMLGDI